MLTLAYSVALALQLVGVVLVALDIIGDQQAVRRALVEQAATDSIQGFKFSNGWSMVGSLNAELAQRSERTDIVARLFLHRLQRGLRRRWIGAGVLVLGTVVAGVASIVGSI